MPLTLVAAAFDGGNATLTLTFDRAIDVAALDGTQVIVDDVDMTGTLYDGTGGATLTGPATVRVDLVPIGGPTGSATVLDATAATGIVAADDGETWPGVSNVLLPFP